MASLLNVAIGSVDTGEISAIDLAIEGETTGAEGMINPNDSGPLYYKTTVIHKQNWVDMFDTSVSWLMTKTYYKNGESWKISDKTCKSRLKLLDENELTASLTPTYPSEEWAKIHQLESLDDWTASTQVE